MEHRLALNISLVATIFLALGSVYFVPTMLKPAMLISFAIVGLFIMMLEIKWALCILLFYITIEGVLKILSNYNPVIHLGTDLFTLALVAKIFVLHYWQAKPLPKTMPPLAKWFMTYYLWFIICFFNPYSIGIIPSLAAAKVYVFMSLLFFMAYYYTESIRDVRWYILALLAALTLHVITSIYQFNIGPSSVTSIHPRYASLLKKLTIFRPFGLSHLPGLPAIYIFLMAPFIYYMIMTSKKVAERTWLMLLVPLATTVLLVCQVRSALLKAIVGSIAYFAVNLRHLKRMTMKSYMIGSVAIAALVILINASPNLLIAIMGQSESQEKAMERSMTLFDVDKVSGARHSPIGRILKYGSEVPFGAGLSRTGAAGGKFRARIEKSPFYSGGIFTDNFWIATIVDIGIPGSLLLTGLILFLIFRGFQLSYTLKDSRYSMLAAAIASIYTSQFLGFYGAEGILYNPESYIFWFFAGILMKLPELYRNDPDTPKGAA